nr:MAG TPA: protein of unknown function DUF285 [Caudoviricetes sp.]
MSISKEIERIKQAKRDIGDAIVRKGGSVSGTIDTYAKSVMALGDYTFQQVCDVVNKSDAKNIDLTMIDVSNVTSFYSAFANNKTIENVNVSNWNTSKVTNMSSVFYICNNLKSVSCENWRLDDCTSLYAMFDSCSALKNFDPSRWNTSKVTNMEWVFVRCASLTSLDLSNWDTSQVTAMINFLNSCTSLTSLDISGWDMSKVHGMRNMLFNCPSLETLKCDNLILPNIELGNIGLEYSTKLTIDSIVGLLNALPHSDKGYSFQIGSVNIAKLSDEQKAIATDKGWTLI